MKKPKFLMRISATAVASLISCGGLCFGPLAKAEGGEAYKWSVQYLVDQSQTVQGRPQTIFPRCNRGIALSPDRRYLYATYHQSHDESGEVRRIDLNQPDYTQATVKVLRRVTAKDVAVDDEGRVYLACGTSIMVFDADLARLQYEVDTDACDGVAVVREGSTLVLLATERARGLVRRWTLEKSGGAIVKATPDGFDGTGQVQIEGSERLRGVAVDGDGRVWVADSELGRVFRMNRDGSELKSLAVKGAANLGMDGDKVLVTQGRERQVTILDREMEVIGTLSVPWEELELAPEGNNRFGSLSGIAVIPGEGFFVANERGQTANQKSTYGRVDDNSDIVNGKVFTDTFFDDNEPILRAELVKLTAQ